MDYPDTEAIEHLQQLFLDNKFTHKELQEIQANPRARYKYNLLRGQCESTYTDLRTARNSNSLDVAGKLYAANLACVANALCARKYDEWINCVDRSVDAMDYKECNFNKRMLENCLKAEVEMMAETIQRQRFRPRPGDF